MPLGAPVMVPMVVGTWVAPLNAMTCDVVLPAMAAAVDAAKVWLSLVRSTV
jgi:hypothetical protein